MAEEIKPIDVGPQGIRPEALEAPTLIALNPSTALVGDALDIVMVVEGTHFHPESVIVFNGHDEPTKFIDRTHVSTGVKPSLFTVPAVCPVAVRNPGFATSNTLDFSFVETLVPEGARAKSKR